MAAGSLCRLTDFLPYEESLWSLPSIATLFGFWIASVGIITYLSSSNKGAFINSFLYALPTSEMLAEAVACLIVLRNSHMLLAQAIFDFAFGLLFGVWLCKIAYNKILYIRTVIIVTVLVFFWYTSRFADCLVSIRPLRANPSDL